MDNSEKSNVFNNFFLHLNSIPVDKAQPIIKKQTNKFKDSIKEVHNELIKITQHVKRGNQYFGTDNFELPNVSFFTDASVNGSTYIAGYGITDETILVSFRKQIKTQNNNLAELIAIQQATKIALSMDIKNLEILTDSLPAIEHIKRYYMMQKTSDIFLGTLKDMNEDLKYFNSYRFQWIARHRNTMADLMSKSDFTTNY